MGKEANSVGVDDSKTRVIEYIPSVSENLKRIYTQNNVGRRTGDYYYSSSKLNHIVSVLDSDGTSYHGSGGESDSSEDISYGPGFVSRIRSRYMSVALRGTRLPPMSISKMRRTTSLDDLLEKDGNVETVHRNRPLLHAGYKSVASRISTDKCSRSDSIKRSQSVEVLKDGGVDNGEKCMSESPDDKVPPPLPPKTNFYNNQNSKNLIRKNKSSPCPENSLNKKTLLSRRRSICRASAGIKDKELPALDTVKETRKIFENKSTNCTRRSLPTSREINAVHISKSSSTSSLFRTRQQLISNEQRNSSPKRKNSPLTSPQNMSPKKPSVPSKPLHLSKSSRLAKTITMNRTSSSDSVVVPAIPAKKISVSPPPLLRPIKTTVSKSSSTIDNEQSEKKLNRKKSSILKEIDYTTANINKSADEKKSSPDRKLMYFGQTSTKVSHENIRNNLKPVTPTTTSSIASLKDFAKKDVKQELSSSTSSIKKAKSKASLSSDSSLHKNRDVSPPPPVPPPRQVCIIKPISRTPNTVLNDSNGTNVNDDKKIDKSDLKGAVAILHKKEIELDEEANLVIPDKVLSKPWRSSLNGTQAQNTIIFNFVNSGRAVPNYIEDDGMDLSVRNRILQKDAAVENKLSVEIETSGVGNVNSNGHLSRVLDEVDHNHAISSTSCVIDVIGGNFISGKSSIRSSLSRSKKLNISFCTNPAEIYEYPSYESCCASAEEEEEETHANEDEDSEEDAMSAAMVARENLKNNIINNNNSIITASTVNYALGDLGSYTPSKIQMTDVSFQLGISRSSSSTVISNGAKSGSKSATELDSNSGDDLNSSTAITSWSSSSSTSSDLLF